MAMLPLKDLLLHQHEADRTPLKVPRTRYGIQHVATKLWVGPYNHWVEHQDALRFDFAFMALAHANEMGFALETFSVEPL